MKRVYTTGQVARICHVASRTVAKWVDSGRLPGYKIPGTVGQDRRIPHEVLVRFMAQHGMPDVTDVEAMGQFHVVLLSDPAPHLDRLRERLPESAGYRLSPISDVFSFAVRIVNGPTDAVLIDMACATRSDVLSFPGKILALRPGVSVSAWLDDDFTGDLKGWGFNDQYPKSDGPAALAAYFAGLAERKWGHPARGASA